MPYKPGESGNVKGRPRGVKNRSIGVRKVMTDLLERDGPALLRTAKNLAKKGDTALLIALMDRLLPRLKPVQAAIVAPVHPDRTDLENRDAIMLAIGEGRLSVDDGTALLGALRLEDAGKKCGIFAITLNLNGELPAIPLPLVEEVPLRSLPAFAISDESAEGAAAP